MTATRGSRVSSSRARVLACVRRASHTHSAILASALSYCRLLAQCEGPAPSSCLEFISNYQEGGVCCL